MKREQFYENLNKRVVFNDNDKRYAELKIRLHYDGLRQGEFFRGLVMGYLHKDPGIMRFVEEVKETIQRYSKSKRQKIKKENKKQEEIVKKFSLNKNDVENIFDLIEEEYTEL